MKKGKLLEKRKQLRKNEMKEKSNIKGGGAKN